MNLIVGTDWQQRTLQAQTNIHLRTHILSNIRRMYTQNLSFWMTQKCDFCRQKHVFCTGLNRFCKWPRTRSVHMPVQREVELAYKCAASEIVRMRQRTLYAKRVTRDQWFPVDLHHSFVSVHVDYASHKICPCCRLHARYETFKLLQRRHRARFTSVVKNDFCPTHVTQLTGQQFSRKRHCCHFLRHYFSRLMEQLNRCYFALIQV